MLMLTIYKVIYYLFYVSPLYLLYGYFIITDILSDGYYADHYNALIFPVCFLPYFITLIGTIIMPSTNIKNDDNTTLYLFNISIFGIPLGKILSKEKYDLSNNKFIQKSKFVSSCDMMDSLLLYLWYFDIVSVFIVISNIIIRVVDNYITNSFTSYLLDNGITTIIVTLSIPFIFGSMYLLLKSFEILYDFIKSYVSYKKKGIIKIPSKSDEVCGNINEIKMEFL